jgi:N6-adenosine-specific RNA methylase IME4
MKNEEKHVAILMDPPWPERGGGKIKRGADRHYKVITKKEHIRDVIIESGVWNPADDSHLYLWVTNTYLEWGLWLIKELGFVYKTNFPWTKKSMGIGQYARGQHEILLFATKGRGFSAKTDDRSVSSGILFDQPRVRDAMTGKIVHSAKPPKQYELIDRRTIPGPRLEMFARVKHSDAWDVWGLEAPLIP